jgi:hypothetical protein
MFDLGNHFMPTLIFSMLLYLIDNSSLYFNHEEKSFITFAPEKKINSIMPIIIF